MKNSTLLLLFFLLAGSFGCRSIQIPLSSNLDKTSVISMRKGPCYGRCPVFEIRIDGSGTAFFKGQQYVEREGIFSKTLEKEETQALFDAFKEADFFALEDQYTAPVSDLPATWLTFIHRGQEKEVLAYYNVPEKLIALIKQVDAIAQNDAGWQPAEAFPED